MPKAKTTSETTKKPRARKAGASHDQIAFRAYQIYQERGYTPGDPMQDWLQAERELTGTPKKARKPKNVVSIAA